MEIAAQMRADRERSPAIARMLQTRRAVAIWCGDVASVIACAGVVRGPARTCSQPAVARHARRRILGLAALAVIALLVHPALTAVLAIATFASARTARERQRRFALHRAFGRSGGTGIGRPARARAT